MEAFVEAHEQQLKFLNIPEPFYESIFTQLEESFALDTEGKIDHEETILASIKYLQGTKTSEYGAIVVIPHLCSWQDENTGMWDALETLSTTVLQKVLIHLRIYWKEMDKDIPDDRTELLNEICDPRTWSHVILYREARKVMAALPSPPYLPQVIIQSESDDTEADLSGPFGFQYFKKDFGTIDCSLAYASPGLNLSEGQVPSFDYVPLYSVPNGLTRAIRYAALLGGDAPLFATEKAKEMHTALVHNMHLARQQQLEFAETSEMKDEEALPSMPAIDRTKIWKVYTDTDDPMALDHPEAGLSKDFFEITESLEEADIIYSYRSLFAPGELKNMLESRSGPVMINQFPYEGAFLQKVSTCEIGAALIDVFDVFIFF
jgi:hypothetical protein